MKFRLGGLCLSLAVVAATLSVSSPVFARSQASLGDLGISADLVPDWYPVDNLPLDTSSWRLINATSSSAASSVGCSRAIPNDGADDAAAISCMLTNAPNRSVIYLPAGEYNCRTSNGANVCFHMPGGERVLRGDGAGVTIITSNRNDMLVSTNNWTSRSRGSSVNWTGGYARGSQVLNVASTSAFTDGEWVILSANPDPEIDGGSASFNDLTYGVKVTCSGGSGSDCTGTGPGQIRVDRPLRVDFDTGGQSVIEWRPYVHWGIEELTLRYANPQAAEQNRSGTRFGDSAEFWISGVEFQNADNIMMGITSASRVKVEGSTFGLLARTDAWQKASIKILAVHDSEFVNNSWTDSHVAFQVGGLSMGTIFAYNRLYRPTAPGYQWCERSFFIHGGSAVEFLVEGNDFECGMSWDALQGPAGHRVSFYRNRGRYMGDNYRSAGGGPVGNVDGSFVYHADVPQRESTAADQGWSPQARIKDWLVAGNSVHRMGYIHNQPGWGTNSNGMGMRFERNVIRSGCSLENAAALNSGCENRDPWNSSRLPAAANTIWTNNPIGNNAAPSNWGGFDFPDSLVYTSAPDWWCSESGSFPNIGAPTDNFSSISSLSRLPAQIAVENGTCTNATGASVFPAPILLP
ncbi:MAG: hypothetical protein AB8G23_15665 [Myxococcota bacterium]